MLLQPLNQLQLLILLSQQPLRQRLLLTQRLLRKKRPRRSIQYPVVYWQN